MAKMMTEESDNRSESAKNGIGVESENWRKYGEENRKYQPKLAQQ
jgi:hypothetical protein